MSYKKKKNLYRKRRGFMKSASPRVIPPLMRNPYETYLEYKNIFLFCKFLFENSFYYYIDSLYQNHDIKKGRVVLDIVSVVGHLVFK